MLVQNGGGGGEGGREVLGPFKAFIRRHSGSKMMEGEGGKGGTWPFLSLYQKAFRF